MITSMVVIMNSGGGDGSNDCGDSSTTDCSSKNNIVFSTSNKMIQNINGKKTIPDILLSHLYQKFSSHIDLYLML